MKPIAQFIGIQEGVGRQPAFELFNLLADIEGHPVGSTVSRATIEEAGYTCPQTEFNEEKEFDRMMEQRARFSEYQTAKREYYHER